MAQIQTPTTEVDYTVCDHCGGDFPEPNMYLTANAEWVCDYTWAPAPLDSCRDYLEGYEIR